MIQATPTTPSIQVPLDVLRFAAEQGVLPYLPGILEITQRVFPNAARYLVSVEDDPEIANLRCIALDVDVNLPSDQYMEVRRQWRHEILKLCPTTLIHLIGLSVHLVP